MRGLVRSIARRRRVVGAVLVSLLSWYSDACTLKFSDCLTVCSAQPWSTAARRVNPSFNGEFIRYCDENVVKNHIFAAPSWVVCVRVDRVWLTGCRGVADIKSERVAIAMPVEIINRGRNLADWVRHVSHVGVISQLSAAPHISAIRLRMVTGIVKCEKLVSIFDKDGRRVVLV